MFSAQAYLDITAALPVRLAIAPLTQGEPVPLTLLGPTNMVWSILASTNLRDWALLMMVTNTNGTVQFPDQLPKSLRQPPIFEEKRRFCPLFRPLWDASGFKIQMHR